MVVLLFVVMMVFFIVQVDFIIVLFFMLVMIMVILFGCLIFIDLSRIQNIKILFFLMGVVVFLVIIYVVLVFFDQVLLDKFFGMFGKDLILIGCMVLWDVVVNEICQCFWFGLGMEGFWYYDSGVVQILNENDNKDYGIKLIFYNFYLEVVVYFGYVGLILFIILLVWVVLQIFIKMFCSFDMMVVVYLVLVFVGIIMMFIEFVLWGLFDV